MFSNLGPSFSTCDQSHKKYLDSLKNIHVFHSEKDKVLQLGYFSSELDRALGYKGPQYRLSENSKIKVVDCTEYVNTHTEYKRCNYIYEYIGDFTNI